MRKSNFIICLLIIICMMLNLSVLAVPENEFSYSKSITDGKMRISGQIGTSDGKEVLLRVLKYNEGGINLDEDLVYLEQQVVDETRKFDFTFKFPDSTATDSDETGDLTPDKYVFSIGIIDSSTDVDSEIVEYYGSNYRNNVKKSINLAKTNKNMELLNTTITDEYPKLLLGAAVYDEYIEKSGIVDDVLKYLIDFPLLNDISELKEQLNEAATFALFQKLDVSKTNDLMNFVSDSVHQQYLGILDSTAIQTFNDFKNLCGSSIALKYKNTSFNNAEESKDAFEFAVISVALKNSLSANHVKSILQTNENILNIDLLDYSLTDSEYSSLAGVDIKSLSDIETKIGQIVDNRKPVVENISGSSKSSSGIAVATPITTDVAVDNKVPFTDLDEYSWAVTSIEDLYNSGIIDGKSEKSFAPSDNVNREEFVKMLMKAVGMESNAAYEITFKDVEQDKWYAPYVSYAVKMGMVFGDSDGNFGVGQSITREDVAVIVHRALIKLDYASESNNYFSNFADAEKISDYAKYGIAFMQHNNIIEGYENNEFLPKNNMSRAEAAVIIKRFIDFKGGSYEK